MQPAKTLFLIICIILIGCKLHAQPLPALIPYRSGDKWGYCDSNKNIRILPQWNNVSFFYNGRATVKSGSTYALIDTSGNYVIPPGRYWNGIRSPGMAYRTLNSYDSTGKWGFIDADNNIIIPFLYDAPNLYGDRENFRLAQNNAYCIVGKNVKMGFIDKYNRVLIPFNYDALRYCTIWNEKETPTYFYARYKGKMGIIDTAGKVMIPFLYDSIDYLQLQKCAIVTRDRKMGVVDINGRILVPVKYDDVTAYNYCCRVLDKYTIRKKNLYGFADVAAKVIVSPRWTNVTPNVDTTFTVEKNDKYGLLDAHSKILLPCKYGGIDVNFNTHSITVSNYTQDTLSDSTIVSETSFDKIARKFKQPWKKYKYDYPIHSQCGGTGWHNPMQERPTMRYNGDLIHTFKKDSFQFFIATHMSFLRRSFIKTQIGQLSNNLECNYIVYAAPPHDANKYSYNIYIDSNRYYAIVDTFLNYIVPPQNKYRMLHFQSYMCTDSGAALIVEKNRKYAAVNKDLKLLINFQSEVILDNFYYHKKWYGLSAKKATIHDNGRRILPPIHLLNSSGSTQPGFATYSIDHFVDSLDNDTHGHCKGFFIVKDSIGHAGIISMTGKTIYPEISFKYDTLLHIFGSIFLAHSNSQKTSYQLIDNLNNEIFPGLSIKYVDATLPFNMCGRTMDVNFKDAYFLFPLSTAFIYSPDDKNSFFFIDHKGTIYADGLGEK